MLDTVSLTSRWPTTIEIKQNNLIENVNTIKKHIKNSIFLAVIKTNAYGHGIVPMSELVVNAGVDRIGVTTVEEGALLRKNGIDLPIHVLSLITPSQAVDVVDYNLTPLVSTYEVASALSDAAVKLGKSVSVHLKIDTGLRRFGIDPESALAFCEKCYGLPGLRWEGIYTHFSHHENDKDWEITEKQFSLFMEVVETLKNEGYIFPIRHVASSTPMIERPDMHLEMVRVGLALIGQYLRAEHEKLLSLKPVMRLTSTILQVKELPPNTPIGYGGLYVTKSHQKIAVIPFGYGDGMKRTIANKGEVLVRGMRAKIVGDLSLDQTLIDVTNIPDVAAGDEVVIIGEQGSDFISVREVAGWMDTIIDEVIAPLSARIPRIIV